MSSRVFLASHLQAGGDEEACLSNAGEDLAEGERSLDLIVVMAEKFAKKDHPFHLFTR